MFRRVRLPITPRHGLSQLRYHQYTSSSIKVKEFDLVVIGSGPSATQCAIDSSLRGKRVAIVDDKANIGGVCVHTGTIPSKTYREAILHLTGYRHQGFYGKSYSVIKKITLKDILFRVKAVRTSEADVIRNQLRKSHVDFIPGRACFLDDHTVSVATNNKETKEALVTHHLRAKNFLIACGTKPAHRSDIHCDGKIIVDSDQILGSQSMHIPKSIVVIGAGVIGLEYASMVNVLPGTKVTVVDSRQEILPFVDAEMVSTLQYLMRQEGARFILGEQLKAVEYIGEGAKVILGSGKEIYGDIVLYAVGRQANTAGLNLDYIGVTQDDRGMLSVNKHYQTKIPHIYASGDCIGFPQLASTAFEQGRLAAEHMWNWNSIKDQSCSQLESGNFPYGIYTIPEISMVGKTEKELSRLNIPYEVGLAKYGELAKGQMLGGNPGVLKILFDPNTRKLLGAHCIGDGATETIHIGQVAIAMGWTITDLRDTIFNYPTLAEAYRVAALNGLGRITRASLYDY